MTQDHDILDSDILRSLPGLVFWKDRASIYRGCSAEFALIAGLSSQQEIVGLTDHQLPWKNGATDYIREDQEVLSGKKTSTVQKLKIVGKVTVITSTRKSGIRDSQGRIIGIIGHTQIIVERNTPSADILDPTEKHLFNSIVLSPEEIRKNFLELPPREAECLYFLVRGFTSKDIGEKLKISFRTVESYMVSLKNRFGAQDRSDLVQKAIDLGFSGVFPESLLGSQTVRKKKSSSR